jgi:sporulation protein YlmC with PRC-barrel domain
MKLSDLLFLEIADEGGRRLGHLIDLRCEPKPQTNEADIREFVYGYGGLAERLGLKRVVRERISWESVRKIHAGILIVSPTEKGKTRSAR